VLHPDRHPNLDFFIADLWVWPLKDDQATMEHPFYSLSKVPNHKIRHYEHNGNTVTIAPGAFGQPTIWDKDILIYCCSQLIAGMRAHRLPNQVIRLTAYDLLVSTNRSTGKHGYDLLKKAFERLAGVRIITDITTGGMRVREGFGLIEWWKIIERSPTDSRMVSIELKLSDWLYRAVVNYEVLTLHRDYFRLDGGLERRIYELCRKHCGNQASWSISLDLLYKKSGSHAPIRNFRGSIKKLAASNHLPEYRLRFTKDQLMVYARSHKGGLKELRAIFD
jgi:plasmid replication initiation protein